MCSSHIRAVPMPFFSPPAFISSVIFRPSRLSRRHSPRCQSPPTCRLLPVRPSLLPALIPVLPSLHQSKSLPYPHSLPDRLLIALLATLLLVIFPPFARLIALPLTLTLPITLPFFQAAHHNANLRRADAFAVFVGRVAALRPGIRVEDEDGAVFLPDADTEGVRVGMEAFCVVTGDSDWKGGWREVAEVYVPQAQRFCARYPYVKRKKFEEVVVAADMWVREDPWG